MDFLGIAVTLSRLSGQHRCREVNGLGTEQNVVSRTGLKNTLPVFIVLWIESAEVPSPVQNYTDVLGHSRELSPRRDVPIVDSKYSDTKFTEDGQLPWRMSRSPALR